MAQVQNWSSPVTRDAVRGMNAPSPPYARGRQRPAAGAGGAAASETVPGRTQALGNVFKKLTVGTRRERNWICTQRTVLISGRGVRMVHGPSSRNRRESGYHSLVALVLAMQADAHW